MTCHHPDACFDCVSCPSCLRAELAALREDPRLRIPLDGPGSHRVDLAELRAVSRELAQARAGSMHWETRFQQTGEELRQARALHAVVVKDRQRIREKYLAELEQARALLARWMEGDPAESDWPVYDDTRAFLDRSRDDAWVENHPWDPPSARDEAQRVQCNVCKTYGPESHCRECVVTGTPRDGARGAPECECPTFADHYSRASKCATRAAPPACTCGHDAMPPFKQPWEHDPACLARRGWRGRDE